MRGCGQPYWMEASSVPGVGCILGLDLALGYIFWKHASIRGFTRAPLEPPWDLSVGSGGCLIYVRNIHQTNMVTAQ